MGLMCSLMDNDLDEELGKDNPDPAKNKKIYTRIGGSIAGEAAKLVKTVTKGDGVAAWSRGKRVGGYGCRGQGPGRGQRLAGRGQGAWSRKVHVTGTTTHQNRTCGGFLVQGHPAAAWGLFPIQEPTKTRALASGCF